MNYIVKARARLDLKSHWRYIARDNLPAADRLLDAAEETFRLIAETPDIGSQRNFRKLAGMRSRAVMGFSNYLVFYQMRGKTVVIVRILHGMRDLPRFFFKP
ncbi:MAG TPA: type II toxin-antitoxin system RelE/ParE family toxin [Verrucomicrobiae bacterium]|nr:type II toxin-antitoxin system RelE/ParE family toxin [Verrucomicrobiae bacterium]